MKKLAIILTTVLLFTACQKDLTHPPPVNQMISHVIDKSVLKVPDIAKKLVELDTYRPKEGFSLYKRPADVSSRKPTDRPPKGNNGKPPKNDTTPPPPPPPPPTTYTGQYVLLLDFDGRWLEHTTGTWATEPKWLGASGHTPSEIQTILEGVIYDMREYDVYVTTDESIFDAAPQGYKQVVIITEDWNQMIESPSMGGFAAVGSWFYPFQMAECFVFSSLLHYNISYVRKAISHEAGHTATLRHQTNGYYLGSEFIVTITYWDGGATSTVTPTMGNPYYKPHTFHWTGYNHVGIWQDDHAILTARLRAATSTRIAFNKGYLYIKSQTKQ